MHRLSASLLFFLLGTFTFAQTPNRSQLAAVQQIVRPESTGCPISFFASRQGSTSQVQVGNGNGATPPGPSQGLHLTLNHDSGPAIESIEVTVYAVSTMGRALPASGPANDVVSKMFDLHRATGSASLSEADVWMQNVGSLSWVDLISINYADGNTWHSTESRTCRAVPSPFLLVGSR